MKTSNSYLDLAIDVKDASEQIDPKGDLHAAMQTQAQTLALIAIAVELEKMISLLTSMTEAVGPIVPASDNGHAGDSVLGKALRVAYYE